jgi:hypothetical protein
VRGSEISMSRTLNLDNLVRCAKCGKRFVRNRGNEKLCQACKPNKVKARKAAMVAAKARSISDRRHDIPAWLIRVHDRNVRDGIQGDELWGAPMDT